MFSTVDQVGLELLGPKMTVQPAVDQNHWDIHYLYLNLQDFQELMKENNNID